jgi:hypothetical protein
VGLELWRLLRLLMWHWLRYAPGEEHLRNVRVYTLLFGPRHISVQLALLPLVQNLRRGISSHLPRLLQTSLVDYREDRLRIVGGIIAPSHSFIRRGPYNHHGAMATSSGASDQAFPSSAHAAFKRAMQGFKNGLGNEKLYSEILATNSAEQVYDLAEKIQKEQARNNTLTNLQRMQPFLSKLQLYAGAIDTFAQAKPDILCLIWGPVKLLIQWASTVSASLVALEDMAREIGMLLPEFGKSVRMFGDSDQVQLVMGLFFQDIMDFYLLALKFYSMPRKFLPFATR